MDDDTKSPLCPSETQESDDLSDEERLAALARTGSMDPESEEAFDRITRLAVRLLDVSAAFITLLDDECQIVKSLQTDEPGLEIDRQIPLAYSYCKTVVSTGSPVVVSDVTTDATFDGHPANEVFPIRGYVGVPLATTDGHALGSICAIETEPQDWENETVRTLRDLAQFAVNELELRRELARKEELEADLRYAAEHDSLTDLANRDRFWSALAERREVSAEQPAPFALLYLDLDDFKSVNDRYGHRFGDRALEVTAERMESYFEEDDLVARVGGDEFTVLLRGERSRSELSELAAGLVERISAPVRCDGVELDLGVSVGIVRVGEGHSGQIDVSDFDSDDLIRRGDDAMYRAKGTSPPVSFHADTS